MEKFVRPDTLVARDVRNSQELISATGEMADQIRSYPWQDSPLGDMTTWSSTLLALVNIMLLSPTPVAIYSGRDLIFLCNDASLRMLGLPPAELLGLPAEACWGNNWYQMKERFESVIDSGQSLSGENVPVEFVRPGKPVELFISYSLVPIYEDGIVTGVFRTLEETTGTVLAMRALAESDARLRMALSVGDSIGVWDWHIQSMLVYADATIAGFYGIDPEAAVAGVSNKLFERMVHPDDIVVLTDAIMDCILTGRDYSVDYRVRRSDDSYRWIQSRGRCIYDDQGHACRVTGIKLDVTDRKLAHPLGCIPANLLPVASSGATPDSVACFIAATVNLLAEAPNEVLLEVKEQANDTQFLLSPSKRDHGRLIGREGRIIRAIRALLQTATGRHKRSFSIDVNTDGSDRRPSENHPGAASSRIEKRTSDATPTL